MIEYKVEDTQSPNLKVAIIYSIEDIENMFIDISIYDAPEDPSTRTTISVPEKFMRQVSEKTRISILDLVEQGLAPEYKKYLTLRLGQNLSLLHTERK